MNHKPNAEQAREIAKADVYRLLSACFYQPEEVFVEEDVFGQLKAAMAVLNPDRVSDVSVMDDSFRKTDSEALLLDYSRLFLGPFDILAKPYGSIYLDGDNVVMGDSTMQALALYREGGFEIDEDINEVPDHVAFELEFLYLLSFSLGQATDEDEQTRLKTLKSRFLNEHLGRWVGTLAEAMGKGAETDFYKRLAQVTEQIVREDMQELAGAI